jgi:hypothetical protein
MRIIDKSVVMINTTARAVLRAPSLRDRGRRHGQPRTVYLQTQESAREIFDRPHQKELLQESLRKNSISQPSLDQPQVPVGPTTYAQATRWDIGLKIGLRDGENLFAKWRQCWRVGKSRTFTLGFVESCSTLEYLPRILIRAGQV